MANRPPPMGPAGVPWPEDSAPPPKQSGRGTWPAWLSLGGEALWVGGLAFVIGLLPGLGIAVLAAGIALLRRHMAGGDDSTRSYLGDVRAAAGSWPYALAALVLLAVMVVNVVLVGSGSVPGGRPLLVGLTLAGATSLVALLRTASAWSDQDGERSGLDWADALKGGVRRTVGAPLGTLALIATMVASVVVAAVVLPLVVVIPGVLCLVTVLVDRSRS